jgi:N-acetyltransferase
LRTISVSLVPGDRPQQRRRQASRAGINAEAKLLLLTYVFETVWVPRADLQTDARNARSRQAIERLGARRGRAAQLLTVLGNGRGRDSPRLAIFSVIAAEWPTVQSALVGGVVRLASAAAAGHA